MAIIAAAIAALCIWHRLRGPVPLVAWAASLCASPRWGGVAGLKDELSSSKVPKNGMVQVILICKDLTSTVVCASALRYSTMSQQKCHAVKLWFWVPCN